MNKKLSIAYTNGVLDSLYAIGEEIGRYHDRNIDGCNDEIMRILRSIEKKIVEVTGVDYKVDYKIERND